MPAVRVRGARTVAQTLRDVLGMAWEQTGVTPAHTQRTVW